MTLVSATGNSAVFRRTGIQNCEIRATISPFRTLVLSVTVCPPSLSGPSHICDQATYTITNFPPGATVQWQGFYPIDVIVGSSTDSTATFENEGIG